MYQVAQLVDGFLGLLLPASVGAGAGAGAGSTVGEFVSVHGRWTGRSPVLVSQRSAAGSLDSGYWICLIGEVALHIAEVDLHVTFRC